MLVQRFPAALWAAGLALSWSSLASAQGAAQLQLASAGHGFGQVLPHQILELDAAGNPTTNAVEIRSLDDLLANATQGNGVLPSPVLQFLPVLPNFQPGNHFLTVTLDQGVDPASVFDFDPAGLPANSLSDLVRVSARDGAGVSTVIPGRVFVGGATPGRIAAGGTLPLLPLVRRMPGGGVAAADIDENQDGIPDGLGFPGTESGFLGDEDLVDRRTIVFVPDVDGDLTTHETLPTDVAVTMELHPGLLARSGAVLSEELVLSTSVGNDTLAPVGLRDATGDLVMVPANFSTAVDPSTQVEVRFTEPIQVNTIGALPGFPPNINGVNLSYGGQLSLRMPAVVQPLSVFALDRWVLTPAIPFPGQGTSSATCGDFNQVSVSFLGSSATDLVANGLIEAGINQFEVGRGPGLVNAPVAPDSILIGRAGPTAISVLDLNGFGASTGNPNFIDGVPVPGNSNFPNNPNVKFGTVPLPLGTCTVDGGSAGAFTLTLDSNLDDALVRGPLIVDLTDMVLGDSLDTVFNNALFPFGCQALGGYICAVDGLKRIEFDLSGLCVTPSAGGSSDVPVGAGNLLSWAPHPNPPPLAFPPLCAAPQLLGIEPTSTDNSSPNLLVPGDPFGSPTSNPPVPPSGLFASTQNAFFEGPSEGQIQLNNCEPFMQRQQVGNFQYVLDAVREELVLMNSNRQVVLDRIAMPAAGRLALSPNLDLLAVSQPGLDQVSFVDIQQSSATFHSVVKVTAVGAGPLGIAWQPDNEDILVCNELEGSLSVLSTLTLDERKRVTGFLGGGPFEVAVFHREADYTYMRDVYLAFILQRDGSVAVFESGPNGATGWGYDDVIGLLDFEFKNPKAIAYDPLSLQSVAYIAHEGPIDPITGQSGAAGVGAITRVGIESALTGKQILGSLAGTPQFRNIVFGVTISVGEPSLSGIPVDLAFDNLKNLSALPGTTTPFSPGTAITTNGRGLIRRLAPFQVLPTNQPKVLLAAMPGSGGADGVVDVLTLGSADLSLLDTDPFQPGRQSVPARGARVLVDAFRQ